MGCIQAWGAYRHGVHTGMGCIQAWGAYRHGVHTGMGCIQAWGAYRHGVHTGMGCIQAWGAYRHGVMVMEVVMVGLVVGLFGGCQFTQKKYSGHFNKAHTLTN